MTDVFGYQHVACAGLMQHSESRTVLSSSMVSSQLSTAPSSSSAPQLPVAVDMAINTGRCIISVDRLVMSPKVSPPYPLNQTLKGHAVGQVRH